MQYVAEVNMFVSTHFPLNCHLNILGRLYEIGLQILQTLILNTVKHNNITHYLTYLLNSNNTDECMKLTWVSVICLCVVLCLSFCLFFVGPSVFFLIRLFFTMFFQVFSRKKEECSNLEVSTRSLIKYVEYHSMGNALNRPK